MSGRNDVEIISARENRTHNRREFLKTAGSGAAALAVSGVMANSAVAKDVKQGTAESMVTKLYETLSQQQKNSICFDWDYQDEKRGLLRTHISNNWRITKPAIKSSFYKPDQQEMIRQVFERIVNPDWTDRFDQQFKDDMGGFGLRQSIAIFGTPGTDKFEFVLTGRHGTIRCDGNTTEHVAFGGPILYGHEGSSGYFEKHEHPDNVFWHQAKAANNIYQMLDGKQRREALLPEAPDEAKIAFLGPKGEFDGIAVADLTNDQKEHVQEVLRLLIEPYRQTDRDEVVASLKAQGGLDTCYLAFYEHDDLGDDGIWDNWRLEGPAFVWHYRGAPHVHVWIHVADDPSVKLYAKNLSGRLRPK